MARQVRGWRARGAPGHSDAKQRSQLGLQRPWDAYYVHDAELDALQERGGAPGLPATARLAMCGLCACVHLQIRAQQLD